MLNNKQIQIALRQRHIWRRPTFDGQKTPLSDIDFHRYIVHDLFSVPPQPTLFFFGR